MLLMMPAMPLAPSRWPMFDFTAPTYTGDSGELCPRNAEPIARASMGSPTGVPVPCASKYRVAARSSPALR